MTSLVEIAEAMTPERSSDEAWECFGDVIRRWQEERQSTTLFEVGGGRFPFLSPDEVRDLGVERYIVNDISAGELERLPPTYERAHFDIQVGPPAGADYLGSCDLVFSKMVFEHIHDPRAAWSTTSRLLRPGGAAFAFIPVLFSPPFIANKLLPERLAATALRRFDSQRHDDGVPKFPAFYRWCRASSDYMRAKLLPLGFTSVDVVPYYGHGYFRKIPLLKQSEQLMSGFAHKRDLTQLASYAYVVAIK